jgi:hypothetical protein
VPRKASGLAAAKHRRRDLSYKTPQDAGLKARRYTIRRLLVADGFGSAFAIEGQNAKMPLHRDGFGKEADLAVAGLILDFPGNGQGFPVRAQSAAEVVCGAHFDVLANTERAGKDGHSLFDGRQVQLLGGRVHDGPQLRFGRGIEHQLDGLVILRAGCVDVNVRRKLDFGGQCDQAAGEGCGIGLLERELQMRRVGRAGDLFAQFREKFGDDVIAGKPFAIFSLEEFLANDALGVDDEISGPRHSLELAGGCGVQHVIGANGLRIGIGEQREIDFAAVGEKLQDFGAVIANGRELEPLLLESGFGCLQLDQLPFAVGSPVGGTEKEENGALRAF